MKEENKKKGNVPNLRFPQFTGEWEEKMLGDISVVSSGGTPNRSKLEYWGGNIPWVSTSLIDFNTIYQTEEKITEEGLQYSSAKICPKGTLLMAMYGQGKTRGKVAMLGIDASINQACASIQTDKRILNSSFLFQNLSKRYLEIRNLSNQGGQENLSGTIIKSINVSYPSLSEQEKMVSFFILIDQRIEAQNKIIEDLKLLKSTISEKLFNRQLRFEKLDGDISSDWRIQKLGDFMTIPDKILTPKIDKNKLLTVKLHLKGIMKNDSTESLSTQGTVYYVRRKGQFIYGKQNLFNGAFGIIPDEYDGFLSSNDVPTFNINCDKINPFYLLYYIGRKNYYVPLESLAIGSGSKRIHESTVLNLEIVIPTLEEQSIIVSAICSIDKKIEIETFVLKGLNSQKQYLLSNLLV